VPTSGSTGTPKWVCLGAEAIRAGAAASAARLGGAGHWLLALPARHIAGLNVVARAALAGAELCALPPGPFTADAFVAGAAALPAEPRYVSLVPAQLHRLVAAGGPALAALAEFAAVLVGGAAPSPGLMAAARAAGVNLVETYGAAETGGGVVYDGVPLDGARVGLGADGRIELAGPMLALGYAGSVPAGGFIARPDGRWFVTADLGAWLPDGRLAVLGRADNGLLSGGVTVHPEAVEAVLAGLPEVAGAIVLGLPHPEWGHEVTALVVGRPGGIGQVEPQRLLEAVREAVKGALGAAHAPRAIGLVAELPQVAPGKPDRRAALEAAQKLNAAGGLTR
jgi:O-succinylbenzoic acid--CoA ligase